MKELYNKSSLIILAIILISCQGTGRDATIKDGYDLVLAPQDFTFNVKELTKIKTSIQMDLIPKVAESETAHLNDFIGILDVALDQGESFFDNSSKFAALVKANADTAIILFKYTASDDLDSQLRIPSSLLIATHVLEMIETTDPESNLDFSNDITKLNGKSLELAKTTLQRFPDEGRAYGQLAFVMSRTGGDRQEAMRLFKRCIDLDNGADFCKDGYNALGKK